MPLAWTDTRRSSRLHYRIQETSCTPGRPGTTSSLALSLAAIDRAVPKRPRRTAIERFEGNFLEGIAVKETLRTFGGGSEDIFVRDTTIPERPPNLKPGMGSRWSFCSTRAADADWIVMFDEFERMAPHIRNRAHFDRLRANQRRPSCSHHRFRPTARDTGFRPGVRQAPVRLISWNRSVPPPLLDQPAICALGGTDRLRPQPHLPKFDLAAGCIERPGRAFRRGARPPAGCAALVDRSDPAGPPFARSLLPVVAPDDYTIAPAVPDKARARGLEIARFPCLPFSETNWSGFPFARWLRLFTTEPKCDYPPWVAKQTGEDPTDNLALVPRSWLEFGM